MLNGDGNHMPMSMLPSEIRTRSATVDDAPVIQAIYAPFVKHTPISFEEIVPIADEMAERIAQTQERYPYLVAERDGRIVGYAYASQHRTRAAYRLSVDVTAYVTESAQRSGAGRALYSALLSALSDLGYHAAFAGITLPNAASVGFHEAMGFAPVGIFREVGFKLGRWHDVGWWQRLLQAP